MACCCFHKRREVRPQKRNEGFLSGIVRYGGAGELYETFTITEGNSQGSDDGFITTKKADINPQGKIPILLVMLTELYVDALEDNKKLLISNFRIYLKEIDADVMVVSATEEFIFIGTTLTDYDQAREELRKVARCLSDGLALPEFDKFAVKRLDIRLYRDPEHPSDDDPNSPLLGHRRPKQSDFCCACCCFRPSENEALKFDAWEKSEFGWFYAELANEQGQETLRKSIERMSFASNILQDEELRHVVEFYINFYIHTELDEQPDEIEREVIDGFCDELTHLLQKHFRGAPLEAEDTVIWFTHNMPAHYVIRCTQCLPRRFSCVIS